MSASQFFLPYTEPENIQVDLDLSNYATQADLRNLHAKTSDLQLIYN